MSKPQRYKDIADELIRMIKRDKLGPGDKLPSEKQLAGMFEANHLTVRKALDILIDEELIHKVPSKGNYIGPDPNRSSKSGLIGVLFPDEETFFYEILCALESRMTLFGYSPVVHVTRRSVEREKNVLELFGRLKVDGIIAAPSEECARFYKNVSAPLVFFDTHLKNLDIPYVTSDDLKGSFDAVTHLLSLGHERIAYVGGKNDLTATLRLKGYRDALNQRKITIRDTYILEKEYSRQWGHNAAGLLLEEHEPPTAVFCGNDTIAAGFLGYMSSRGLSCPSDMSVVGFGNLSFSDSLGLTTVNQSCVDMANTAWSTLVALMNHERVIEQTILPASLILRRSAASLREI